MNVEKIILQVRELAFKQKQWELKPENNPHGECFPEWNKELYAYYIKPRTISFLISEAENQLNKEQQDFLKAYKENLEFDGWRISDIELEFEDIGKCIDMHIYITNS